MTGVPLVIRGGVGALRSGTEGPAESCAANQGTKTG
jgi:hypothetical protein